MKKIIFATVVLAVVSSCAYASNVYGTYQKQAEEIYQKMSVSERIGQLLMPSYLLLADAVSPNATACQAAVNAGDKQNIIPQCGLDQIQKYHLGAVLTGGGPYVNAPTLRHWAQLNQWASEQHKLGSPLDPVLLTGNDAIHGNMHVQGAVIFPHDIGLGATHDLNLIKKIGGLVGQDSLASGFNWAFMPTIAVAQDLRWGRTYESFGNDPGFVKKIAYAYISGFQNIQNNHLTGTLATAKHFLGDGATQYGFDEGDDQYQGNEVDFWHENGQPYEGALNAQVGSIMASYSAIDGDQTRMHFGGKWNIVNQFKNQGIIGTDGQNYRFNGFVVSDWNGPTRASYFYDQATHSKLTLEQIMAKAISSGVDMIMLGQGDVTNPFDPQSPANFNDVGTAYNAVYAAYKDGLISPQRLQDAVTRILAVKLAMQPHLSTDYTSLQTDERNLALTAAQESLVLLKNNQATLPLQKNAIKNIVFIGDTDDLGLQNGGWTINWQGQRGNQYFTGVDQLSSGATTLEAGIKNVLAEKAVNYYHVNEQQDDMPSHLSTKDSVAIALVAEMPYAEFMGDIGNPYQKDAWFDMGAANGYNTYISGPQNQFLGLIFTAKEAAAIQVLRSKGIKVISVVYSGRPVVLTEGSNAAPFNNSDAVIAAFLPGTLGGKALANAIFGDYHFGQSSTELGQSNTLTFPWPRNMDDVANHFSSGSLYPVGYGLKD